MIGYWRNVLPEVGIAESRPEYSKENYRLYSPFPRLQEFVNQYDLATCRHPFMPLTEAKDADGVWREASGRETVPKAHSHIPAFVLLVKALEQWRSSHEGNSPQNSTEKDQFRNMLDELQISKTGDEDNFNEAKSLARHAYSPFEISSEVKALFADEKAQSGSNCDEPFWVVVRAMQMFVNNEGSGCLPLSGNLPDMHSDTKSYVELQNIYREQAQSEMECVAKYVKEILQGMGKAPDAVPHDMIQLVCKNAANLRLVTLSKTLSTKLYCYILDLEPEILHPNS